MHTPPVKRANYTAIILLLSTINVLLVLGLTIWPAIFISQYMVLTFPAFTPDIRFEIFVYLIGAYPLFVLTGNIGFWLTRKNPLLYPQIAFTSLSLLGLLPFLYFQLFNP